MSVLTSFETLNSLFTAAFEERRDITQSIIFFRLAYFNFPSNVHVFKRFYENYNDDSPSVISDNSSNACFLHSASTSILSATTVKYGNLMKSSWRDGGQHFTAFSGKINSKSLFAKSLRLKRDLICCTSSTMNSRGVAFTVCAAH